MSGPPAPRAVHALSDVIRDLEGQLDRMISMNDAVKKDLAAERSRRLELERTADDLTAKLHRAQRDAASSEDLLTELAHLRDERSRLAREADVMRRKLDDAQQERRSHGAVVERLRAGRADALEDLQSVESQFECAMQLVADLRARVEGVSEGHDALQRQLLATDERLRRMEKERDSLQIDVEESRAALDDIRRSLVEACAAPPYATGETS